MLELIYRGLVFLGLIFTIFIGFAAGADEIKLNSDPEPAVQTEMQKAIAIADEIQSLNRGDFDVQKRSFHPSRNQVLDRKTLSLSAQRK